MHPTLAGRSFRLLLSLLIGAGISLAAGDTPTYHTAVDEVRLRFSALDQNNHGVATLHASDIAIVDKDFVVRDFQSFARSDVTNLEIAFVIDTSESVTRGSPREMASTVAGALDLLSQTARVPEHNISVISFEGLQPALLCAGDCRLHNAVAGRLASTRPGSLTPLFDAIVFASNFLSHRGEPNDIRILILFSDGEDTISRNSLDDAVDDAQSGDVQIYAVSLKRDLNDHPNHLTDSSQGAAVLRRLASSTGGGYFPARDGANRAVTEMLEGLRATYTVSYQLPGRASGFHSVRVLPTHNLNLTFRSRSGYYYPKRRALI